MRQASAWQQALQACQKYGFRVLSLDEPFEEDALRALADEGPPLAVQAFARYWNQAVPDAWHALLQSAATVNSAVAEAELSTPMLTALSSILACAEHAALTWQPAYNWPNAQRWGYFLQIRSPKRWVEPEQMWFFPPATPADIATAEAVLRLKLPPGFRHFVQITNGLSSGIRGSTEICGVGPANADWAAVQLNRWMDARSHNEIAAAWRSFQGDYDYARIMDWEEGVNTFETDETILVPFAYFAEAYCFDRTRPNADGEYPVMFWDHELRGTTETHPDFLAWFAERVESYIFPG
jgi:hypothetical protein